MRKRGNSILKNIAFPLENLEKGGGLGANQSNRFERHTKLSLASPTWRDVKRNNTAPRFERHGREAVVAANEHQAEGLGGGGQRNKMDSSNYGKICGASLCPKNIGKTPVKYLYLMLFW